MALNVASTSQPLAASASSICSAVHAGCVFEPVDDDSEPSEAGAADDDEALTME
jgi:hypothetical protein